MLRTSATILIAVILASCAPAVTGAGTESAGASAHSIHHLGTAFLKRGAPQHFRKLDWLRVPSPQDLARIYPDSLPGKAMAGLKCGIGKGGELMGCKVDQIEPRDPEMVRLVLRLADKFRLTPDFVKQTRPLVEWVRLDLSLENRRGRETVPIPCLPAFCVRHYGVPPPPPPPPKSPPPERYQ